MQFLHVYSYEIGCVSLTFEVIRSHWMSSLYNQRSTLNDNTQGINFGMYIQKVTRPVLGYMNLSLKSSEVLGSC